MAWPRCVRPGGRPAGIEPAAPAQAPARASTPRRGCGDNPGMAIQWFPGHMHLTKKAIIERCKSIDGVIEMLDARLPGSSANPMLAELTRGKPTLKLLNKQDLADPARTAQWLAHYNALPGTQAIATDASQKGIGRQMVDACRRLLPHRGGMTKPLRLLICGIPNVGKSTLINALAGKRAAKTGDEPGITKIEARIVLAEDFYVFDTPGVLWPRIVVPRTGENLAASGAVGRNAFDEQEVVLELLSYLRGPYLDGLVKRYKLDPAKLVDATDEQLLEHIGRRRGAVLSGGRIDMQKVSEAVLADFRHGELGRITLETPEEYAQWLAQGLAAEAARQARLEDMFAKKRPKGSRPDGSPDEPVQPRPRRARADDAAAAEDSGDDEAEAG